MCADASATMVQDAAINKVKVITTTASKMAMLANMASSIRIPKQSQELKEIHCKMNAYKAS